MEMNGNFFTNCNHMTDNYGVPLLEQSQKNSYYKTTKKEVGKKTSVLKTFCQTRLYRQVITT